MDIPSTDLKKEVFGECWKEKWFRSNPLGIRAREGRIAKITIRKKAKDGEINEYFIVQNSRRPRSPPAHGQDHCIYEVEV